MRSIFVLFADGALDFTQLLHQVVPCVNAACGITNQKLDTFLDGFLMGRVANRGGISIGSPLDDGHVQTLAPDAELLYRCSTEGVCSCQHDRITLVFE